MLQCIHYQLQVLQQHLQQFVLEARLVCWEQLMLEAGQDILTHGQVRTDLLQSYKIQVLRMHRLLMQAPIVL